MEEQALKGMLTEESTEHSVSPTTEYLSNVTSDQLAEYGARQIVYPYYLESTMWLAITETVDENPVTSYFRPCNFHWAPWALKKTLEAKEHTGTWLLPILTEQYPVQKKESEKREKDDKPIYLPAWKKYTAEEVVAMMFCDIEKYVRSVVTLQKRSIGTLSSVYANALIYKWYGLDQGTDWSTLIAHFRELNEPFYPMGTVTVLPIGSRYSLLSPISSWKKPEARDPGITNRARNFISAAIIASLDAEVGQEVETMLSSINQKKINELINETKK